MRVRGEGRILRGEVLLPARGALHRVRLRGPANKLFKLISAIVAFVFKDRHTLSVKRERALRSTHRRARAYPYRRRVLLVAIAAMA